MEEGVKENGGRAGGGGGGVKYDWVRTLTFDGGRRAD